MKLFVYDDGKTESYVGEWDVPNGLGMYFFGMSEEYGKPRGYSMTVAESIEFVDAEQFVTIRRKLRAKDAAKSFAKIEDDRYRREWDEKMRPYREAEEKRLEESMRRLRELSESVQSNPRMSAHGLAMLERDHLGALIISFSFVFLMFFVFAIIAASS